jgi:hypothetical protein
MANKTISQLPNATALTGAEIVPLVQDGITVQESLANILVTAPFPVNSVNSQTGAVSLTASDVGALPITGGTISGATTISTGGLTVSAGGATVSAGNLAVSAGTITASGNISGSVAPSTTMTDGFLYIPKAAGPPTGTATVIAGRAPLYFDSTNNKLWIGIGSGAGAASWKGVVVA